METKLLGQKQNIEYDATVTGYSVVALRILLGWVLFVGGIDKLIAGDWTSKGFLTNAIPEGNPFNAMWPIMVNNVAIIDPLVMWGLTLTGLGLMIGAFVRWNAFWAAVMMIMFWAASLPLENGILIDDHVVYAVILLGLGALGAGRLIGIDAVIEKSELVKRHPQLKYLLG